MFEKYLNKTLNTVIIIIILLLIIFLIKRVYL